MIRLEKTYSDFTDEVLKGYAEVKEQAKDFDPVELYEARQEIRPENGTGSGEAFRQGNYPTEAKGNRNAEAGADE